MPMEQEKAKNDAEKKLEKLKEKQLPEKVKTAVDEKLKQVNQPINK